MQIIHMILLFVHAHSAWPNIPLSRITTAIEAATQTETEVVPAALLLVIAQHESDLVAATVSWRASDGKRVDTIAPMQLPQHLPLACGLVQTIAANAEQCTQLLQPIAAMRAGVAELTEELTVCKGNLKCALSIYAGGTAGHKAWQTGKAVQATRFADYFFMRTRQLAPWLGQHANKVVVRVAS